MRGENSGTGLRRNKRDWWQRGFSGKGDTSMNSSITGCLSVGRKIHFRPLQPSGSSGSSLWLTLSVCVSNIFCSSQCSIQICTIRTTAGQFWPAQRALLFLLLLLLIYPLLCPVYSTWIGLNGSESWWEPRWLLKVCSDTSFTGDVLNYLLLRLQVEADSHWDSVRVNPQTL